MLDPRRAIGLSSPIRSRSSFDHCGDVLEHPASIGAFARAVTALVERERGQAGGEQGAGEVVVALLARTGAMQDHHASRIGPWGGIQSE